MNYWTLKYQIPTGAEFRLDVIGNSRDDALKKAWDHLDHSYEAFEILQPSVKRVDSPNTNRMIPADRALIEQRQQEEKEQKELREKRERKERQQRLRKERSEQLKRHEQEHRQLRDEQRKREPSLV